VTVSDRRKEVKKLFSKTRLRRLVAVGLVLGALAAVSPATGLASNPGGGGRPVGTSR
jgi:hypothetical protein